MKYFLSLCCIIKNERYLEEFIIYYRLLGVEHFYIYDNESTIPISQRLINPYFTRMCTIKHIPGKIQQLNAYNDCITNHRLETKWLIIVDGDEYIFPKKENHYTIRDFLKNYKDYHAIGINWMMFGSSFHDTVQNGYVIDNYRYCEGKQNKHIKTICKPEFVINVQNPHYVILKDPSKYIDPCKKIISGPFNENNTIDIIQINHYWGKSKEEQLEKHFRGRATVNELVRIPVNPHANHNNIIDNLLPEKYLDIIIKIKNLLTVHWEIYKLLNSDLDFDSEDKYYEHLFNQGINEKRFYKINDKYPEFSHSYYKEKYKDLQNMSNNELEKHYILFGVNEKRICNA